MTQLQVDRVPKAGCWASGIVPEMTVHYVELQDRKRANLARIAKHDAYLVREEPDGTLIWEPATVITQAERRLLQDAALVAQVSRTRTQPDTLRRRDRSGAPRAD